MMPRCEWTELRSSFTWLEFGLREVSIGGVWGNWKGGSIGRDCRMNGSLTLKHLLTYSGFLAMGKHRKVIVGGGVREDDSNGNLQDELEKWTTEDVVSW